MSELNTNTLSVDYTLDENTGAARTAQIYTEVDGEVVDVLNVTQAASNEYEAPSTGPGSDITIDMSTETQQAINAIKAKIANFRSLLNTTAYTTVKDKAVETIDYYKSQLDNGNTDSYKCVQIVDEYPLEIINSYYLELNYLLENYEKVQNFLAEVTGNIADLKINNINRTLNNLEEDYNNLKEVTEETSELTQAIIDSFSNDNVVSPDEQLTLKLKLDEITAEYTSISTSVHALIAAYEEANTPKVDENGEEHKEAFIAEDVAEYLEKLTTTFESYQTNYNNAYKILSYYTNEATERDEFGNIAIISECNLNDLPLFYDVRQKLLDIYYEANSYYTTYNRFGSKTTWIGKDGIYSGTIMADNLRGWCIEGLTVQSGIKSELPNDLTWYKYNGKEATSEADAFTKITADYRDENGNPVVSGPTWQIYKDGTGHLAKGGIRWNNDEVIFGDSTKISITREDGTKTVIPLGEKFSDMSEKIDGYISEWQNDNIISYTEQRSMLTVAAEIKAEHKQITNSISNLIKNLREAQDKIDVDTTDSVIETYINSLDATKYLDATNKALAAIEYYTKEDTEGTFRSVTGSVEISADYPLSDISDYYDVRETLVEKYNLAADFYTNNINTILSGVIEDVKVNAETINDYIATWTSDNVISPAELAEFRVLYNTIKSEQKDITIKISKLDKQYAELIATINDENTVLKSALQDYKDSLDVTEYNTKSTAAINTLQYYINTTPNETGFIDIVDDKPIDDLYDYYVIKDRLVNNYNNAFTAYNTYINGDITKRINDLSDTNEKIDLYIASWVDNNNVDPAEQVEITYIGKEIKSEAPVLITAAAVTLENIIDIENNINDNAIDGDDFLLNETGRYKNALDSTLDSSKSAIYNVKKNTALSVITYYTETGQKSPDGFIELNPNYPLSAIDEYYNAREDLRSVINEADGFCTSYNNIKVKDILSNLSDTNEKIDSYIESWLDDNGIDPAEQTELSYIKKEIIVEAPGLKNTALITLANIVTIEDTIKNNEKDFDDVLLVELESLKNGLSTTDFDNKTKSAMNVINYYTSSLNKNDLGFVELKDNYPLSAIDEYYTARENLAAAINKADGFCLSYNGIANNNVMNSLSDVDTKINDYINDWKDENTISPAEINELSRVLTEITVEEVGIIASVDDIKTKLQTILTEDADKITVDIKTKINNIISTLDTTEFKSAADAAEEVLSYYSNAAAYADPNGFIAIVEDKKLEKVEKYYAVRETLRNNYNIAIAFYGDYNRININVIEGDLEQYVTNMKDYISAVSRDNVIDNSERLDFSIRKGEISSNSSNLINASLTMGANLNTLAGMTNGLYETEINKHLSDISSGKIDGYAKIAIDVLDYYIKATPDANGLVEISAGYPLSALTDYYVEAARLQGAINNANAFYTKATGDYANKKISAVQQELNTLSTDLKNLKELQGSNAETMQGWIDAWTADDSLNGDELKELANKIADIQAEEVVIKEAVNRTLSSLNDRRDDGVNLDDINKYYGDLNTAYTTYNANYTAVVSTYKYYNGELVNDQPVKDEFGNVKLRDAWKLTILSTYAASKQSLIDIHTEAASFITSYHRFGSKLTWLGDDGIYSGKVMGDQIQGGCIEGVVVQSSSKANLPDNVKWYKYDHSASDIGNGMFTEQYGNNGPSWQIYKDGSGHLANGQISWQGSTVTLGDKVTINWANVTDGQKYVDEQNKELSDELAKEKQILETTISNNKLELTNKYYNIETDLTNYKIQASKDLSVVSARLEALEAIQDGSTSGITDLIGKITSDAYISPDEKAEINSKYVLNEKNYNKLVGIINALIYDFEELQKKIDNDEAMNINDSLQISDCINDLNNSKNSLKTVYDKSVKVCKYYLGLTGVEGEPVITEDGFIEVNAGYDLNTLTEYEAIENEVARIASQYTTYYISCNRFGTKTTYIGADGLYSGTITGDNIKGMCLEGVSVQSGKDVALPSDLTWQKYNSTTNKFTAATGGTGPTWQIYNDGSGHLAKGNINWTENGDLTVKGELFGAIGNSTNTDGDVDIKGNLNIKSDDHIITSISPDYKFDTITDANDKSVQRYITISSGIPNVTSVYVWNSDSANIGAPYTSLYTINAYDVIKNNTSIYDVFYKKSNIYLPVNYDCTVSSKNITVSEDGSYTESNNNIITLYYNGVAYKYNRQSSKINVSESQLKQFANTNILSDGTIYTNNLIANDGVFNGEINSGGTFTGKLDVNSGYVKNCNISSSNITINGNNSLIAYKPANRICPSCGAVYSASSDITTCTICKATVPAASADASISNEIFNVSPGESLSTSDNKLSKYVGTETAYEQNGKNDDITWTNSLPIVKLSVIKGDIIEIPKITVSATIYQARKRKMDKSAPKFYLYIKYDGDNTKKDIHGSSSSMKSLKMDNSTKAYNGSQYVWKDTDNPFNGTTVTAPSTGTATIYLYSSVMLSDRQFFGADKSACTFKCAVNDYIIIKKSDIQAKNKTCIGNNGIVIYTSTGNIIRTVNGSIELLSEDSSCGLKIDNLGIRIKRQGVNSWEDL